MNALKAPRPIRDARRDVDGTGLMGLGWLGPPKFIGFFCLIHKLHWIFGCFLLNPDLWNCLPKSSQSSIGETCERKVTLLVVKNGVNHVFNFSRSLMGYTMESLAGTHRVERFVGPKFR
jgi:hypothetical protein